MDTFWNIFHIYCLIKIKIWIEQIKGYRMVLLKLVLVKNWVFYRQISIFIKFPLEVSIFDFSSSIVFGNGQYTILLVHERSRQERSKYVQRTFKWNVHWTFSERSLFFKIISGKFLDILVAQHKSYPMVYDSIISDSWNPFKMTPGKIENGLKVKNSLFLTFHKILDSGVI